jgi:hypothetical protein
MKIITTLLVLFALVGTARAQLGMGGTPHPSAALDVQATDKAFYPPRLTTAQRKAIFNPQPGAFVFDLDKGSFYIFDGQNWLPLAFTTNNDLAPIYRTAADGVAEDRFGASVAISGDYALVGSPFDQVGSNVGQGSVYVFVRSGGTWTQQTKLTIFGGAVNDHFGYSVALSGNYALVGCPDADVLGITDVGAAYVFERSGSVWTQRPIIFPADGEAGDNFGLSVALTDNYALVGSPFDDISTFADHGSAYVLVRLGSTWSLQAKLIPSVGGSGDNTGGSVAISDNYAVVGSRNDQIGVNQQQGSVSVFRRSGNTWPQQAKLTANNGRARDNFGISVAVSGDYILVGSPGHDGSSLTEDMGAAYVFQLTSIGWSQQAQLFIYEGATDTYYGGDVALVGDYALIGAPNVTIGNGYQGASYLYKREGLKWNLVRRITDNSPSNTRNGSVVGLSTNRFIIGQPFYQDRQGRVGFGTVDD